MNILLSAINFNRLSSMVSDSAVIIFGFIHILCVIVFFRAFFNATSAVQRMEKEQQRTNALLAKIVEASEAQHQEQVAARLNSSRTNAPFKPGAAGLQSPGKGDAGA